MPSGIREFKGGRGKRKEPVQRQKPMSTSPMPTSLFGTPIFSPLSSTGLAYLFVILIAGDFIGGTVINGLLVIHRRIAMPSFEDIQQP
jgi:hypothetical protein